MIDSLAHLMDGFGAALTPGNLLFAALGVLLGTAIGVLPGIGPAMAVALLLPVTYAFDPTGAFIMFAGIYFGAMFGGSTTSILLNTPGESAAVVAAIEGNPMAKSGRGAQALATAAIGHFVGGFLGVCGLVLLAPLVASVAVDIGAPDYFAIMVLAFVAVTSVLGSSRIRGFASLALGLTIGLVGLDPISGQPRLTFGVPQLADGIDVVIVAVGLFAVGEALWVAAHLRRTQQEVIPVGRPWLSKADLKRTWKPWLRGPFIGFPFGSIPAGGAEIPTFLSYVTERRLSKHKDEFGKGAIEGVAGPESAASASSAGTMSTMLTLGLPTTAIAAVMLAAFQQFGIQPGPLLFQSEPDLVWTLIASLFIGLVLLLVLNLPLAPLWATLLRIPRPYLYAGILFFACVGAYAVSGQPVDILVLLVIGAIGFLMRRFGLPVLPAILGVILGPDAELQLRRSLQIADGDVSTLFSTPLAIGVYTVIALLLLFPLIRRALPTRPAASRPGSDEATTKDDELV
jgi:putative tricarboxylic transport membrane protein